MVLGTILIGIVIFQFWFFRKTWLKQKELDSIFPHDSGDALSIEDVTDETTKIISKHSNESFDTIIKTINDYLKENKGAASDFHLIKDVVERNSDSIEEEINTLIPMPLYMGLMGTMAGIIIGIVLLLYNGGLDSLLVLDPIKEGLDSLPIVDATQNVSVKSANPGAGIIALLNGVALAMISSIIGIALTTLGSYRMKTAKRELDIEKNGFLSWIQIKLLPSLAANTTSAIYTLQRNLSKFNSTFSENIKAMGDVFDNTRQAHKDQLALMGMIEKLDVNKMASANVLVLKELQNSVEEIDKFNQYLNRVSTYVANVEKLNGSINEHLNRTKVIEEMGVFFKSEVEQIERRKGVISDSTGAVDLAMSKAVEELKESSEVQLKQLINHSAQLHKSFGEVMDIQHAESINALSQQKNLYENFLKEQQALFESKSEDANSLIDELKGLSAIKKSMENIDSNIASQSKQFGELGELKGLSAIKEYMESVVGNTASQNKKIDELTKAIYNLADNVNRDISGSTIIQGPKMTLPLWMKVSIGIITFIIGVVGLMEIVPAVMDLCNNLNR